MQVFKCALRIIFRNPTLLLIYAVALGFMGVAMASGVVDVSETEGAYERESVKIAVIDRDDSDVSHGIEDYLSGQGELVEVEDTETGLQDAVAKGQAAYILVVPDGFGADFVAALEDGSELPRMDSVYSYYSAEGALVDSALASYISTLEVCAKTQNADDVDMTKASKDAAKTASETADVQIINENGYASLPDKYAFYLKFDIYVFFTAIVSALGALLAALNRTDVRRRNLVAPISSISCNLQIGAACMVVTAVVWAWVLVLGAVAFPESFASIGPAGLALMALTTFCFALICLSVAFLVGQLGLSALAANAIGNILGLVISFLGGAWMSLDIAGPEVTAVAHFLPGYWYTDALSKAAHLGEASIDQVMSILSSIGVLALFAAAIFCVALVAGRMRVQTSESGGNAAATTAMVS